MLSILFQVSSSICYAHTISTWSLPESDTLALSSSLVASGEIFSASSDKMETSDLSSTEATGESKKVVSMLCLIDYSESD